MTRSGRVKTVIYMAKKVNTRQKGRRNELRAAKILEDAGYDVQLTPNPTKWSTQNDMFGLWDLMAVKHNEIRFIQVKSNRMVYGALLEPYIYWQCPPVCTKEIWVFHDRVKEPTIKVL
jgi:hypothetical protein